MTDEEREYYEVGYIKGRMEMLTISNHEITLVASQLLSRHIHPIRFIGGKRIEDCGFCRGITTLASELCKINIDNAEKKREAELGEPTGRNG